MCKLKIMDDWTAQLDSGGQVDVIYTDFAKAFDTVPHQKLVLKIKTYNIAHLLYAGLPAGPTLFSLFAGQQLNILGSQRVDLYWRQGVLYIESAEQSRTAEPNKIDG